MQKHVERLSFYRFEFMRDLPEPKPYQILSARAFGISELRVSRHLVHYEHGNEQEATYVRSIWTLRIRPSFSLHGFLTVATAEGIESGGRKTRGWRRALLCSDDGEKLISNNVPGTVEPFFKSMPLVIKSNVVTLDGIGYELIWQSDELCGTMQFSNPQNEKLRSLEAACLSLAEVLSKQSDDHKLFKFIKDWRRYVVSR